MKTRKRPEYDIAHSNGWNHTREDSNQALGEEFKLPPLTYPLNALEPFIDAKTMEIHHTKHHQTYVTNLNKAVLGTDAEGRSIEGICRNVSKFPAAVRQNAGGHYNHSLWWRIISPAGGGLPYGHLFDEIRLAFKSFDEFKRQLTQAALNRFGSGWAWLSLVRGQLSISSTPNQDNPLMDMADVRGFPILGIDVWEHAYYLKYQNRRPEYVAAFWNIVNWQEVAKRLEIARKNKEEEE